MRSILIIFLFIFMGSALHQPEKLELKPIQKKHNHHQFKLKKWPNTTLLY
ncbi:MAG: hypothetical protein KKA19_02120 [Candidatus Margulisbacteria bacterium]|nr:hypothetical protein [Candidatus Margulisiibacteriota bacterium]